MSLPQFQRTTFETSRAAEYFSAHELQAQTGQPEHAFATVVLKELADNALDACEAAGVAPELVLDVHSTSDTISIAVADNGLGIPAETVRRILNFQTRSSDKAAYRAPTRGAQGNALKTVLGIPHALGGKAPIVIAACGIRHTIHASVDPAGELRILPVEETTPTSGTRIEVRLPADKQHFHPNRWAAAFSAFNPHALVRIRHRNDTTERAHNDEAQIDDSYQPSVAFPGGWRKFLPTDLTSPWWYSLPAFEALVFAHLKHARDGGRDLPLREFVRQFRGLSGSAKAKAVCDLLPAVSHLSGFEADPGSVATLRAAMQRVTGKPPTPDVLGSLGEEHLLNFLDDTFGVIRHWYKSVAAVDAEGVPFSIEVMLAETETPGELFHGVNFSPTFSDPFSSTWLHGDKISGQGVRGYLHKAHALPDHPETPTHTAAVVHLACPALTFLDRGKTRVQSYTLLSLSLEKALWAVSRTLYQEEERRRKDAARQQRHAEARAKPTGQRITLKDAVFHVLPEAMEKATGGGAYPVSARTLFYQVRPLIQAYTSKPLDYDYFAQTLLTVYRQEHGVLAGLYYDPRGVLYEPHTGQEVKLGTREVEAYRFPDWLYNKILYVEKKGLWPILQHARFAERYDMAIIAAEGYATEAARVLFAQADQHQAYRLFVLHDADPDGYNIARTLAAETKRMPGYQVEVIDLGLRLEEALTLGLATEQFTRKKELPAGLTLSSVEREHFGGKQTGHGSHASWVCQRVELNAFNAPDLVAYIERQLIAAGATEKVIPDTASLPALAEDALYDEVSLWVSSTLAEWLDTERLKEELVEFLRERSPLKDLHGPIRERLRQDPTRSWRSVLGGLLQERIATDRRLLRDTLRAGITSALQTDT